MLFWPPDLKAIFIDILSLLVLIIANSKHIYSCISMCFGDISKWQ